MGHSMVLVTMTEADEIIAEARELPLKDAAFLLWRECIPGWMTRKLDMRSSPR
jgi:hypothetical protein